MLCNAFNIGGFKTGRIIFATCSTVKAVYVAKSFFMQFWQLFQHFIFISTLQKLLVFFLITQRFFLPVMQYAVIHSANIVFTILMAKALYKRLRNKYKYLVSIDFINLYQILLHENSNCSFRFF